MDNKLIGRFSSLACADMTHITSYYNGVEYKYLMLKNGNAINIDLIGELPTTEHNGVEVKIVVNSITPYRNALYSLSFVPNLYVHSNIDSIVYSAFNDRHICDHGKYVTGSITSTSLVRLPVLVGCVLYEVDDKYISVHGNSISVWQRVIPKFSIGELEVTPNREQLLYSDKTIKALNQRYQEVSDELIALCKKAYDTPYENLWDWYTEYTDSYHYLTVGETSVPIHNTFLKDAWHLPYHAIKEGELVYDKRVLSALADMQYTSLERCVIFTKVEGKLTKARCKMYLHKFLKRYDKFRIFSVPSLNNLRGDIFTEYIQSKLDKISDSNAAFVFTDCPMTIKSLVKGYNFDSCAPCRVTDERNQRDAHKSLWLYRELSKSFAGKILSYDIVNSAEYIAFRDKTLKERRAERKANQATLTKKIRVYVSIPRRYWTAESHFDAERIEDIVARIESIANSEWGKSHKKCPVYWCTMHSDLLPGWKKFLEDSSSLIVTVADGNYKYLTGAKLPRNWRELTEDMVTHHPYFITAVTRDRHFYNPSVMNSFPSAWRLQDNKYDTRTPKHLPNEARYLELAKAYNGPEDLELIEYANKVKKCGEMLKAMAGFSLNWEGLYVAIKLGVIKPTACLYAKCLKQLKKVIANENID
jgi:hypothetical protein